MTQKQYSLKVGRRAFLHGGMLLIGRDAFSKSLSAMEATDTDLRFGLITDLHYADKPSAGSRHYRETLGKLEEAAKQFAHERPAFLVELGDLIDRADTVETELRYLNTINKEFSSICTDRHYVLGNHCVDTLKKEEFLQTVQQPKSYYSFDRERYHFIVLDSCFRSDGVPYGRKNFEWTDANIPKAELDWLRADLDATDLQTIVLAHQRLDVSTHHGVKNNAQVRKVLESSDKVLAVFQGHSHKNDLNEINGIHYCTMVAMVEGAGEQNNGYSLVTLTPDHQIMVTGFRKQSDYDWKPRVDASR